MRGFTYLEALMVFSVIAIVCAVPVYFIDQAITRHTEEVFQHQLFDVIRMAKTLSQSKHATIMICGSQDQKECSEDWSSGILVFNDVMREGMVKDHAQIITYLQPKLSAGKLHWRAFPNHSHRLVFENHGSMMNNNGMFWYCPRHAKSPTWAITVNKAGHARLKKGDQSHVIKDSDGKELGCF